MWLLYADETNLDLQSHEFFVYGALAIHSQNAGQLHTKIKNKRTELGIDPEYMFKFNPGPPNLNHNQFIDLKQYALEQCEEANCRAFLSLIHHKIVKNAEVDAARRNAISTVIYHFDCMLRRENDNGIVLIDRFNDGEIDSHLRTKMGVGLIGMPYSGKSSLDKILGIHFSTIGQSHFCSLIDIALGSFRFAINAFLKADESKMGTAQKLLKLIQPLMIRNSKDSVDQISLSFSPKYVKSEIYQRRYVDLMRFLSDNGIGTEQDVTKPDLFHML